MIIPVQVEIQKWEKEDYSSTSKHTDMEKEDWSSTSRNTDIEKEDWSSTSRNTDMEKEDWSSTSTNLIERDERLLIYKYLSYRNGLDDYSLQVLISKKVGLLQYKH